MSDCDRHCDSLARPLSQPSPLLQRLCDFVTVVTGGRPVELPGGPPTDRSTASAGWQGRMKPGGLQRVRMGRETRQSILARHLTGCVPIRFT